MTIIQEFEYFKPATLNAALKLLTKFDSPSILAGGTDLVPNLKEGVDKPDVIIDIKGINTLKKISFKDDILTIGSLVTFNEIIESKIINKKFPILVESAKNVACVGIRNSATIAGNLCSCVPCMDSAPVLCLYEAEVSLKSLHAERSIPIWELFLGPRKTAIQKGEILTKLSLPFPAKKHAGCFLKLKRYSGEDLAQASVSILAFEDNTYRVAFGSVAPVPARGLKLEAVLNGNTITDDLINKAKEIIPSEIFPITDVRATKEYRLQMVKVMFERAIKEAVARLNGKGTKYGHYNL